MFAILICIFFVSTFGNPTDSKKFQNALNQQNIQTILSSIEERLRNLDKIYNSQYSPNLEGKLEQYARKLNTIDSKLSRFESLLYMEIDKITQNISNQGFKDVINTDHIIRKIDADYEKVNHRLVYIEMKFDMQERKILDKFDLMIKRFQKMEEYLTTREGDIEVEIADVLAVVDDIKLTCMTMDVDNITKSINTTIHNTENIRSNLQTLNDKANENYLKLHDIENNINNINKSIHQISRKGDKIKHELNEYNTIMKTYDWQNEKHKMKSVENILNQTRNEQQNGFRNLIVQVGRLEEKPSIISDRDSESMQLVKKIDSNFKDVIEAQKYFLESCHRLQMDEPQLESKIGEVLEKLIDIFERKTAIEIKDIENLEQLIKSHDVTMRRNSYSMSNNLGVLIHKSHENKEELKDLLYLVKNLNEKLILNIDGYEQDSTVHLVNITDLLQKFENQINKINNEINTNEHGTNILKTQIQLEKLSRNITSIKDISLILKNIELKIDNYIETKNYSNTKNIINTALTEYFQKDVLRKLLDQVNGNSITSDDILKKIFGVPPNKNSSDNEELCTDLDINVRGSFNSDRKCFRQTQEKVDQNQKMDADFNFVDNSLENCTDVDIDVRGSFNSSKKCLGQIHLQKENSTNSESKGSSNITFIVPLEKCTEIDIDVRGSFNSTRKCLNQTNEPEKKLSKSKNDTQEASNCTDIDIDVRNNFNSSRGCLNQPGEEKTDLSHNQTKTLTDEAANIHFIEMTSENCTNIDIDVRSSFNSSRRCLSQTGDQKTDLSHKQTNNTTDKATNIDFIEVASENCTDIDIDVRSSFNSTNKCLNQTIHNKAELTNVSQEASSNIDFIEVTSGNCTDIDIDVRNSFNSTNKCINHTSSNKTELKNMQNKNVSQEDFNIDFIEVTSENCADVDIDIRGSFNSSRKCFNRTSQQKTNENKIEIKSDNCTDFGIEGPTKKCSNRKMDLTKTQTNNSLDLINNIGDYNVTQNEEIHFNTIDLTKLFLELITANISEDRREQYSDSNCTEYNSTNCIIHPRIDVRNNLNATVIDYKMQGMINYTENQFINNDSEPLMHLKDSVNKSQETDGILTKIDEYQYDENDENLLNDEQTEHNLEDESFYDDAPTGYQHNSINLN